MHPLKQALQRSELVLGVPHGAGKHSVMLRLQPAAQTYAWGREAASSEVASLTSAGGAEVDPDKRYAELWMGTHPAAPSLVAGGRQTLSDWLAQHPEALGEATTKRFGADLPFLFKVLSVDTALSIQSHPDKELAGRLHAERPEVYRDANHKPEMALALTPFEALCGFAAPDELAAALEATPELRGVVGDALAALVASSGDTGLRRTALKEAFSALMLAEAAAVAAAVQRLTARLQRQKDEGTQPLTPKERLALRLNEQYPEDVGVLAAFFLNLVALRPGQAIYLPANEPHAYVSGELMEAMATSDNVIRAGLTPKLRDTAVLCDSLTYSQGMPAILEGERAPDGVTRYAPPFDEFEVRRMEVPPGGSCALAADAGPQIFLVQRGGGRATTDSGPLLPQAAGLEAALGLARGAVLFVPAGTTATLQADAGDEPMLVWGCAVNSRVYAEAAPATGELGASRLREKRLDLAGAA